ncbi:MAG TPA: OsmC family peroxiredoxin [Bacillus bacterium]|uniref:OsmC family protein n=1 Tax=Siminovitchia fordii TaxID=254759 RepID=A0ABQ4K599_9BACI|nr:OsmC family protein [Siminovitchia fordii]GIN20907.1 OsmC family protein [Siminovitchia fordii]HBZ12073.1 OsmC family peroxiredoxin [Bacillus sp. (in: firmicutes)]
MATTAQLLKVATEGKWEKGLQTSINIRNFETIIVDEPKSLGGTDEGPNPVELVLAGLSSCASVMIALIAKEQNFSYTDVKFKNEGTLDLRGLQGIDGVSPHFQSVTFDVYFITEESQERINALKEEVEKRCPVLNLLADAGIKVEGNWVKA